jgi:hypothetical protein
MMIRRWGAIIRDRGLAHLSRYLGAWRICGLEPHMQRQQGAAQRLVLSPSRPSRQRWVGDTGATDG